MSKGIKFWKDLPSTTPAGNDKLMIGKNSTGVTHYINVDDLPFLNRINALGSTFNNNSTGIITVNRINSSLPVTSHETALNYNKNTRVWQYHSLSNFKENIQDLPTVENQHVVFSIDENAFYVLNNDGSITNLHSQNQDFIKIPKLQMQAHNEVLYRQPQAGIWSKFNPEIVLMRRKFRRSYNHKNFDMLCTRSKYTWVVAGQKAEPEHYMLPYVQNRFRCSYTTDSKILILPLKAVRKNDNNEIVEEITNSRTIVRPHITEWDDSFTLVGVRGGSNNRIYKNDKTGLHKKAKFGFCIRIINPDFLLLPDALSIEELESKNINNWKGTPIYLYGDITEVNFVMYSIYYTTNQVRINESISIL